MICNILRKIHIRISKVSTYRNLHITLLFIEPILIADKKSTKIIKCFSIKQNFNDLRSSDSSNESLKIIYGLRVLFSFSLVMGHSMINTLDGSIFNFSYIEQVYILFDISAQALFNSLSFNYN